MDILDKLKSQIGDDVQYIFDPEALFKAARDEITALRARLEAVTEERNVQNDLRQIAEDAADELRARLEAVEKRAESARWNVDEDGNLVRLCRGDHDKDENCSDHEELFVPLARAERAEAALATARRDAVGLCRDIAMQALTGDADGRDIYEQIDALANEAETSALGMP